jgi:hypothetical protein
MFRFVFVIASLLLAYQAADAAPLSEETALDVGFRHLYNLDFPAAHHTFENWQALHPEDPLGAAANGAAYLFAEFERLHILDLNRFLDNEGFEAKNPESGDPRIKAAFEAELTKSDEIAYKALAESPTDRNALFAKVLVEGLRGDYAVLIEKRTRAGLNSLQTSRTIAEKLISLDSTYYDAYLAVGIENYLLGLRSAPVRWMLRVTGSQTNKDKGIAALSLTAKNGRYLRPYACLLMAIAALRDHDKSTAKQLLGNLAKEFPHNRLYQLELARLRS